MRKTTTPAAHRTLVTAELVFDYELRPPLVGRARERIVLLHGYQESGRRILSKLEPALPADALIVAPNGPFPLPRRTENGYAIGYAWYVYNPATGEYVIDMRTALGFLPAGLAQVEGATLPTRVIGFSQGGYLAPFVARRLGDVAHVIGLACEYLVDELERDNAAPPAFRMDGVHGADDDVVPAHEARESHARLKAWGVPGELSVLTGVAHGIDDSMRDAVRTLVLNPLS